MTFSSFALGIYDKHLGFLKQPSERPLVNNLKEKTNKTQMGDGSVGKSPYSVSTGTRAQTSSTHTELGVTVHSCNPMGQGSERLLAS